MSKVYLSQGAYWPSKEDAKNLTNPISIKDIPEGSGVIWYNPYPYKVDE